MNIISRISAAVRAFNGKADSNTAAVAAQLLDQKKNTIRVQSYAQPTKSTAPGDLGSDEVCNFAWQTQEAIINAGLWFSLSKLVRALGAKDELKAEEAVDNLRAWNYSAMRVTQQGNPVPNKRDEELLALLDKVVKGNNKTLTIVPDNVLVVLARCAKRDFAEYKAEHLAQVAEASNGVNALLATAEERVVGHADAFGCDEAMMPAGLAIDKVLQQMQWMARTWKDKSLVATEIPLMEADINYLETLAKREAGRFQKYTDGTLSADGLEVYEALKKSERELDAQQDAGYEEDALQVAFREAEEEVVHAEVQKNRRRIRAAA